MCCVHKPATPIATGKRLTRGSAGKEWRKIGKTEEEEYWDTSFSLSTEHGEFNHGFKKYLINIYIYLNI